MSLDRWIGIPYANRGSSFAGCDCWGLVWLYHREELRTNVPRYAGYASAEDAQISEWITERWHVWADVQPGQERHGDVIALRVGRRVVHCGIVLDGERMLHILEGRSSCIESYRRGLWAKSIERVGRWML